MFYGTNAQLALDNLYSRMEMRRNGNTSHDGKRIALVIEGGGMRSACSGAGAAALSQLGYDAAFDEVYATSAGVMNASYFISKQVLLGMLVYFENCTTRSFLNPARFWKILDVDYIVDHVAKLDKCLDIELIESSSTHFLISVCDQRTGEPVLIDTKTTKSPLFQVLRAAMAIPVVYNRSVEIDGVPCIDSGTVLPFALLDAIERDCTDILVLLTRPASFLETKPSLFQRRTFSLLHSKGREKMSQAFAERHVRSTYVRNVALGRIAPSRNVNIVSICPDDRNSIEAFTTNPRKTFAAAKAYGMKIMKVFGHDPHEFALCRNSEELRQGSFGSSCKEVSDEASHLKKP